MAYSGRSIKDLLKKWTINGNSCDELNKQPILDADAKLTLFKEVTLITANGIENYSKAMAKQIDSALKEKFDGCREHFIGYENRPDALEKSHNILLNCVINKTAELQQYIAAEVTAMVKNLENAILRPISDYQKDVNIVREARKDLKEAYTKVDLCKSNLDKAKKDAENSKKQLETPKPINYDVKKQNELYKAFIYAEEKASRLEKELDDATLAANERYDKYTEGLFKKVSEENDLANYFLEYLKIQQRFHSQICRVLEAIIPDVNNSIYNYVKKPVFGCALEEYLKLSNSTDDVSPVIRKLIDGMIKQNAFEEEGLFRIAGSKAKMNRLISSINAGYLERIEFTEYDVHCLASVLKQYLRDLPDSIMCNSLYDEWLNAAASSKVEVYKNVLKKLPKTNYENLKYIVKFIAVVIENSEKTKMNSNNIGICFGVSLLNSNNIDSTKCIDMSTATTAFDFILSNHTELFPDANLFANEYNITPSATVISAAISSSSPSTAVVPPTNISPSQTTVSRNHQTNLTYSHTITKRAGSETKLTQQAQPFMRNIQGNIESPVDPKVRHSMIIPDKKGAILENHLNRLNPIQEQNVSPNNPPTRHHKKPSMDSRIDELIKSPSPSPSPDISNAASPRVRRKGQAPAPPPVAASAVTNNLTVNSTTNLTDTNHKEINQSNLSTAPNENAVPAIFPRLTTFTNQNNAANQSEVQKILQTFNGNTNTSNGSTTTKMPLKSESITNLQAIEKPTQPPPTVPARPPPIGFNVQLSQADQNSTTSLVPNISQSTQSTLTSSSSSSTSSNNDINSPTNTLVKPPKPAVPRKPTQSSVTGDETNTTEMIKTTTANTDNVTKNPDTPVKSSEITSL